jgi:hypothetical protein
MSISEVLAGFQPKDAFAILISCASFVLSGYALWVAQFNHGRLKMTQPTLLCMMRELPRQTPKIFLRTLLFTSGTKGRVVEGMFLKVHQPHGTFIFDFWGHTESGKLTLGSGLFVGPTGVACDHHFNPRYGSEDFLFVDGRYRVEVFAVVVRKKPKLLMEITFAVDGQQAAELIQITELALWLVWNARSCTYEGHLEREPRGRP